METDSLLTIAQLDIYRVVADAVPHTTGVGLGYVIFQHLYHVRRQGLGMETPLCLCRWRRLLMQGLKI